MLNNCHFYNARLTSVEVTKDGELMFSGFKDLSVLTSGDNSQETGSE